MLPALADEVSPVLLPPEKQPGFGNKTGCPGSSNL